MATQTELNSFIDTHIKPIAGDDKVTATELNTVLKSIVSELFARFTAALNENGSIPPNVVLSSEDLTEEVDGDDTLYVYEFTHNLNCEVISLEIRNNEWKTISTESYENERVDNYKEKISFYQDIPAGETYLVVATKKLSAIVSETITYIELLDRTFDTWLGTDPQKTVPGFIPKKDSALPLSSNFLITDYNVGGTISAQFYALGNIGDRLYFEFEEYLKSGELYNVVIIYTTASQDNTRFIFGTENNIVTPTIEPNGFAFAYTATEDGKMLIGVEILDDTLLTDIRLSHLTIQHIIT